MTVTFSFQSRNIFAATRFLELRAAHRKSTLPAPTPTELLESAIACFAEHFQTHPLTHGALQSTFTQPTDIPNVVFIYNYYEHAVPEPGFPPLSREVAVHSDSDPSILQVSVEVYTNLNARITGLET